MKSSESPPGRKQYLWAIGAGAEDIPIGEQVGDRYTVTSPCIWLDTKPEQPTVVPDEIPEDIIPYLKAQDYRLHVSSVYGLIETEDFTPILLLDNTPVDRGGNLYTTLAEAWPETPAVRQVYWLWQMLELWPALMELGLAASLLVSDNIRIEGWRVRLLEFYSGSELPLAELADAWSALLEGAQPQIRQPLEALVAAMRNPNTAFQDVVHQVNHLLLTQTTEIPLRLTIAGGTLTGPNHLQNEDSLYPSHAQLAQTDPRETAPIPRLAIVCDGVGGHEGGEVASQLVVRSLQLQLQALLKQGDTPDENAKLLSPEQVMEQIEAAIRVVNNLVVSQNDDQGRTDRQRMGTTLVMALQLPQRILTDTGWRQTNELYLAHVGDSRAYWITPNYCHQLTIDDDVATREVIAGRNFYRASSLRPDAGALTQAVGTREAKFMTPHIQRFIIEEDGVLLLCSDGLSDFDRVEQSWANYIGLIVKDIVALDAAVESWLELAKQKNGHDDTSLVLMHCKVSADTPDAAPPSALPVGQPLAVSGATTAHLQAADPDSDLTEASQALLYGENTDDDITEALPDNSTAPRSPSPLIPVLMALIALLVVGAVSLLAWRQFNYSSPNPIPPQTNDSGGLP
ncbi:MAG: protein phosphatase 2C domain-containing protein [Leptolyngbyaceae cyanobacterium MO_188.B28]|nr:protein phosphatase 2C domain-containing protein [Leptolyngbyaceae cyanobacterium MO_188.B28]